MVEYKCDKCHKSFNRKSNFDYHMNKKFPCRINEPDEPINEPTEPLSEPKNSNVTSVPICPSCQTKFATKSSLKRHLNGRCKKVNNVLPVTENTEDILKQLLLEYEQHKMEVAKMMEEKNKEINELRTEMKKLNAKKNVKIINNKNKINNTANIGQINQNNNINVKLVAFKKEDLSFITDDIYKKILNKGFMSVPNLVEYIHFNKDHPQYRNVYISNMRDKYALVYDGENWQLRDREMILKELIDDKTDILSLKFEEMIKTLDEFTIRKFTRFLDEGSDDEVVAKIKDDLRMILYNNRRLVESSKNVIDDGNLLD